MIFCYSGTGNSYYIAQRIADELHENIIDLNETLYLIFDYPYKYYTFKHFEV